MLRQLLHNVTHSHVELTHLERGHMMVVSRRWPFSRLLGPDVQVFWRPDEATAWQLMSPAVADPTDG